MEEQTGQDVGNGPSAMENLECKSISSQFSFWPAKEKSSHADTPCRLTSIMYNPEEVSDARLPAQSAAQVDMYASNWQEKRQKIINGTPFT